VHGDALAGASPQRVVVMIEPDPPGADFVAAHVRLRGRHERADVDALAALLRDDARLTMPAHRTWYAGRAAIRIAARQGFDPEFGQLRTLVTAANRQSAAAHYPRRPGESQYRPLALDALRIDGQRVAEITSFVLPGLFPAFGLPPALSERSVSLGSSL
jgi:RNA polymerase sigma-70 factor, ECF subfamily